MRSIRGKRLNTPSAQSVPIRQCEEADVRPSATALCCRLARCDDVAREWDAVGEEDGGSTAYPSAENCNYKVRKGTGVSKRLRALRGGRTGTSIKYVSWNDAQHMNSLSTVFDAIAPRHRNVAPTKEEHRTRTVQQAALARLTAALSVTLT